MSPSALKPTARSPSLARIGLTVMAVLASAAAAWWVVLNGDRSNFELVALPTANRTLNQLTAVVLTCMALIVPLTSNLYSPKLVKLYVTHPLIVAGLAVLVGSNLLIMPTVFLPATDNWGRSMEFVVSFSFFLILLATLPFLYAISRFLRPSYFLRLLTERGYQQFRRLQHQQQAQDSVRKLFDAVDVVTNIAMTGMNRGDRQLVLMALNALHRLLCGVIEHHQSSDQGWRSAHACFVPGLAREGRNLLRQERIWPEAYVLAQMLKVMEVANKRQHEILGELADQLVDSARLAFEHRLDHIVELHVMALNTLLRESIEERDLRRFQNVSYHFRELLELFVSQPERLQRDARHLLHYGRLAQRLNLEFGLETVIYDLAELLVGVARRDPAQATKLLDGASGEAIRHALAAQGGLQRIGWRGLIYMYWECRAAGLDDIARGIEMRFLNDPHEHKAQIARALGENRALHFEFNDRLVRFAHFSAEAERLAHAFGSEGKP
ncbi:hypothetical protein [Pseudomarimonas arenosa]|uniref:DUF2254 domain-containing protein n=1 Tax=Pseudomarimonas arenosa TaxID=2774145 RepID=A0AAW3ZKK9_9GAMM|nr:hypothetical protein [Pseudomarimonas arenosa]MBD8525587.1 hypothetical protein [Pseudomarimonas arenosa]